MRTTEGRPPVQPLDIRPSRDHALIPLYHSTHRVHRSGEGDPPSASEPLTLGSDAFKATEGSFSQMDSLPHSQSSVRGVRTTVGPIGNDRPVMRNDDPHWAWRVRCVLRDPWGFLWRFESYLPALSVYRNAGRPVTPAYAHKHLRKGE
jgi:hypothetical protein